MISLCVRYLGGARLEADHGQGLRVRRSLASVVAVIAIGVALTVPASSTSAASSTPQIVYGSFQQLGDGHAERARLLDRRSLPNLVASLCPCDRRRLRRRLRRGADRDPLPQDLSGGRSLERLFRGHEPEGKPLDLGTPNANADANAHFAIQTLKREFGDYNGTFFGFFIGNKDP